MRLIFKSRNKIREQAGDTIVEVLIAVAIVGAVLAGAFTVSQKSVAAVRNSQEQGEMLQILQSQVELTRALALETTALNTGVYATSPRYFCINPATKERLNQPRLGNELPGANDDTFNNYENQCKFGDEQRYNVAVKHDNASKIFTFYGRWDRLGGGKNAMQLSYRITPSIGTVSPPSGNPPTTQACTNFGPNLIINGNFTTSPGTGPGINPAAGFTSDIPYRGDNVYPDDDGVYGLTGWRGGFSIVQGDRMFFPNIVHGFYFRGDGPQVPASQTYFYSNPQQSINEPRGTARPGNTSFKGTIWSTTIPASRLEPNTKYEFRAYFDNLLYPENSEAKDPIIEFTKDGTQLLAPTTIVKTPRTATTAWQTKLYEEFTTPGTVSDVVLRVNDSAGTIHGDDFGMTGLSLRKCL